jgi:hypothetical protein
LLENVQIQTLFVDIPITVALILEILENDSKPSNPETKMCQIISFNFFVDFLSNVADGKVLVPNRFIKISLEEVYYFITGLKNVPVCWDSLKYKIKYQLNDTINRFRPSSNTCPGVAQLTLPIVEKYKDMEDGWIDGVLSLEHGFGRLLSVLNLLTIQIKFENDLILSLTSLLHWLHHEIIVIKTKGYQQTHAVLISSLYHLINQSKN